MNRYNFDAKKHIHTLDGKPLKGTTTVIKEVLPPMLSWYGSGMAVKHLGWFDRKKGRANYLPTEEGLPKLVARLDEIRELEPLEYLDCLDEAYGAHNVYMKEKGDWGTKTHEAIKDAVSDAIIEEGFLRNEPYENEAVERFATWGRGKKFLYSEVHTFSEKMWVGGIIDLVYEDNGVFIGDVKTGKSIYESHFIQEGMYDAQQAESGFYTAEGKKIGEGIENIKGYTVVNIPTDGGIIDKTYYDTDGLRAFSPKLVEVHATLQTLKQFLK